LNINYGNGYKLNTWLYRLIFPTPITANIRGFFTTLRHVGWIKGQNTFLRAILPDNLGIKFYPGKRLAHLISICLLSVRTISRHIYKVVFTSKSHVKNQNIHNKFLSGFGRIVNVSYYCLDKAFSLVEKHHVFGVLVNYKTDAFLFWLQPCIRIFTNTSLLTVV